MCGALFIGRLEETPTDPLNSPATPTDNQCMDATTSINKKKRNYTPTPPLPRPQEGVPTMTRLEAAEYFGVAIKTWTTWEHDGRVTIPRYRVGAWHGHPILYAVEDLSRLREEFRKLDEPYPDPDRPGCYRVPVRSRKQRMEAIIEAEDLPKVRGKNWNWSRRSDSDEIEIVLATMTERQTPLKRIIMGVENAGGEHRISHINGDPLDCRRANLVDKTSAEVARGVSKMRERAGEPLSSKYKGVCWCEQRGRWLAQIRKDDVHRHLGRFEDEVEAAEAYDKAARELFGEFAHLNFPDGIVPARTGLDPYGNPTKKKQNYRVTPPLPPPPEGVAVMTREEAAVFMGAGRRTFCQWEREGRIAIPRYRVKPVTGTPILYVVADLELLRDNFRKAGQPYADPQRPGVWRVPIRTLTGYLEAIIDTQDLPMVQGKCWNYTKRKGGGDERGVVILNGEDTAHTPLKRIILGVQHDGVGISVVHANGDPLDCRRCNLVVRTQAQKVRGAYKIRHRAGEPTTSRYKGVCWLEREGKWQAQIRVDDVPRRLGLFDDEIDAANAYDEAARQVWGEEARVNFPEPGELPTAVHATTAIAA